MIKREELTNPQSCMSRAADHEMTFVLLARDQAAPDTIRRWAHERIRLGKNSIGDQQIVEALHCASYMEQQRVGGIGLEPSTPVAAQGQQKNPFPPACMHGVALTVFCRDCSVGNALKGEAAQGGTQETTKEKP